MGEAASCANGIWGWPAKVGEAASCTNGTWGWPAKVGEAASCANGSWGWPAKVGEAASCANWSWGWRAKVEIRQEVEGHSKVFVMASKCVSGNDFCVSSILSEQIFPSNKTVFKMNKRTSPNGGREEL